jgi:uncharacterized OB-fold protein
MGNSVVPGAATLVRGVGQFGSFSHELPEEIMAEQQTQQVETGPRPILPILKLQPKPHLVGTKCSCGAIFLDVKRLACSKCGSTGPFQEVALSDKGKVWVFSVVHQSFPGIKTPYITAIIDLPEGISVRSNLVDVDPDEIEKNPQKFFGMAVEMVANVVAKDRQGNDVVAFQYRPSKN